MLQELEVLRRAGHDIPLLEKIPELEPELYRVWNVFQTLHAARPVNGFAACPLSIADIAALLQIYELDPDDSRDMFYIIQHLDGVWLHFIRTRKSRETGQEENDSDAREPSK